MRELADVAEQEARQRLFLGAGAEINSRTDDGRTAVTEALRGKHPELADYLRSKGGHGAEITADLMAPPKE